MVEQKSPKVLCWLSGRLPHQEGAAGGVPNAVCADSEVTLIGEAMEGIPSHFIRVGWSAA